MESEHHCTGVHICRESMIDLGITLVLAAVIIMYLHSKYFK